MKGFTIWLQYIVMELAVSLRAAEDDNDLAGHLAAWWEVVTGRITSETRWRLSGEVNT